MNHIAPYKAADAVFGQMVGQMEQLRPRPLFLASLGDFAGPGSMQEHENYFKLVECLNVPDFCILGAHDRDHPTGAKNYCRLHGSPRFQFVSGNTRFVAVNSNNDAPPSCIGRHLVDCRGGFSP